MRLAVTRDRDQLNSLFTEAAARKIEIIPLPLTRQKKINFDIPSTVELSKADWLFFTSANGVTAFFEILKELGLDINESIQIAAVGKKTAKALKQYGYSVSFLPSENYGQKMFEEFIKKYDGQKLNCIYPKAKEVIFDPNQLFEGSSLIFHSLICYETITNEIDKKSVDTLTDQDYLLFTAPSSVVAYNNLFGQPLAKTIAIGHTTENQMIKLNWKRYAVMNEANVEKVWEYL